MEKNEKDPASPSAGSPFTAAHDPVRETNSPTGSAVDMPALGGARQWVENSPLLAVVGAFAAGTFVGVMMRD